MFQKNSIETCILSRVKQITSTGWMHEPSWKILKEMGIPDHLTCLLRNLYAGQEATIRSRHGTMDWFQIGKGVHHGCILSLYLFNLFFFRGKNMLLSDIFVYCLPSSLEYQLLDGRALCLIYSLLHPQTHTQYSINVFLNEWTKQEGIRSSGSRGTWRSYVHPKSFTLAHTHMHACRHAPYCICNSKSLGCQFPSCEY